MIKFLPLGGASEIGANCYYLQINNCGILLDCGMHPRKTGVESLPRLSLIENKPVDFLLISHAHQDHLDSLPYFVNKFPYVKIITTPQTRAVAELTLHNSVSIMKENIADDNFRIYSHDEIDLLIRSIEYKACGEVFEISASGKKDNNIKVCFYDAGHIIGSAGILLQAADFRIFYTGDINLNDQSLLKGASLPVEKINLLILECTYGATDSSLLNSWNKEELRLADSLNKIFNRGGSVLIPVFALGKMQEILSVIHKLMSENKIPDADIYTGGIADKISRIYDYNRFVVNMKNPGFELSSVKRKNYYEVKNYNEFFKSPSIVLASSGMMLEKTASFRLAKRWLRENNSAIFTVGYMDEQTPGYKIAFARKGDKIRLTGSDEDITVRCEIKNFRFTAHSKREELLEIVKRLSPEIVILVHGEEEAIDFIGNRILKQFKGTSVYKAETGNEISIGI